MIWVYYHLQIGVLLIFYFKYSKQDDENQNLDENFKTSTKNQSEFQLAQKEIDENELASEYEETTDNQQNSESKNKPETDVINKYLINPQK